MLLCSGPDGHWIAFTSGASNLVPGFVDGNGPGFEQYDLFFQEYPRKE